MSYSGSWREKETRPPEKWLEDGKESEEDRVRLRILLGMRWGRH